MRATAGIPDQLTSNQALFLAGALVVGGFALGRAIIDHALDSKKARETDLDEFEEQHYRAAGFYKAGERPTKTASVDKIVSAIAGIAGIAYTIYTLPNAIEQWKKLGSQ